MSVPLPPDMSAAAAIPDPWQRAIVGAVTEAVGEAQVLLIGSRATRDAHSCSDCDISVVVPSYKILLAARRLPAVAARLAQDFGIPVSVNPIPRLLFDRAHHSLYLLKTRTEGLLLNGDALSSVATGRKSSGADWDTNSSAARRAEVSYLLSAVHTLVGAVLPSTLMARTLDAPAEAAIRKARTQVAQACLLVRGMYMPAAIAAEEAERQGLVPADGEGIDAFAGLRRRLLQILSATPMTSSRTRSYVSDLQYVALSAVRGQRRLPVLGSGIAGRLASASVLLLRSLSPEQPGGYDPATAGRAWLLLPRAIRPGSRDYLPVRDVVLSEWASAQPLVGVMP